MIPILSTENVSKSFPFQANELPVVSDVSLSIRMGEWVGLVGESGSGKTTFARMLVRLVEPTSGKIMFHGKNLKTLNPKELKIFRKEIQMIFQDPFGSLNPRFTVKQIVGEAFEIHSNDSPQQIKEQVLLLLGKVGLSPEALQKRPREFSGGQRQRIGIARALAVSPKLLIADEPVSALDVSIQAQILNLLLDLQEKENLSFLLISHDLRVVQFMASRIVVMYLGHIVEMLPSGGVEKNAAHPYTKMLWDSVSSLKSPKRTAYISRPPGGCIFQNRCPLVEERCRQETPKFREIQKDQWVACHLV